MKTSSSVRTHLAYVLGSIFFSHNDLMKYLICIFSSKFHCYNSTFTDMHFTLLLAENI